MALGSVVILVITVGLSVASFRRGWDLDAVGTPIVTALGDAATLPTLFLASLLVHDDLVVAVVATACVVAVAWSVAPRRGAIGRTSAGSCCTWSQ